MSSMITKVLSSIITMVFALVGGIWTAITVLNATMDSKVAVAKTEMRIERSAQIGEVRAEIRAVKTLTSSIDNKVDILIQRGK